MHCNAVCAPQFRVVQLSIVQFIVVQFSIVQFTVVQFSIVQFIVVQYSSPRSQVSSVSCDVSGQYCKSLPPKIPGKDGGRKGWLS